jgi:hypothetical protein
MGRSFTVGLTIGSVWLITAATGFSSAILGLAAGAYLTIGLPMVLLIGGTLIAAGIFILKRALRLPADAVPSRRTRRPFALIIVAETVGWGVANAACLMFWTWRAIAAVDLIIVGLHFLPLARLFKVQRYQVLGALFCVIPAATLLLIPAKDRIGEVVSWIAVPSFGCSMVAAVFGVVGLVQASQLAGIRIEAGPSTDPKPM